MDNEQVSKDFEEWARSLLYSLGSLEKDCEGVYLRDDIDNAHCVWQAAHAKYSRATDPQPIETAPKDGTWILVYAPEPSPYDVRTLTKRQWHSVCWAHQDHWIDCEIGSKLSNQPTLWMPLPEVPK